MPYVITDIGSIECFILYVNTDIELCCWRWLITTLGYALLSLLARQPLSGYDLAQQMSRRVGSFWHARHSQIYPELARLEAKGLITHEVIEQQDRPDKKLYSITEAGIGELRQWVTEDVQVPVIRDELVLKAYSLWLVEPEQAIALFRTHERYHTERLAHYETLQAQLKQAWEATGRQINSPWFSTHAVLQRGIGYEREYAAWCRWVADTLEQHTR